MDFDLGIFIVTVKICCSLHAIMTRHDEPSSATLWLCFINLFDLFGIIFYLTFGVNRYNFRSKKIGKVTDDSLTHFTYEDSGQAPEPEYINIIEKLIPETATVSGNAVSLYEDGDELYPEMLEQIKQAKSSIHLCSYIIMNDHEGKTMLQALKERAENGVDVKVIYDSVGSQRLSFIGFLQTYPKTMRVKAFTLFDLFAPNRIQLRNHRKVLVIDGKIAFVGGINISSENRNLNRSHGVHDLHCRIDGPVVHNFQKVFLRDWSYVSKDNPNKLFNNSDYFPKIESVGENKIRVTASGPGQSNGATKKIFLTAIQSAQKSLTIMTPYFVPESAVVNSLMLAAARGVDIKIIVPQKSDHFYVQNASRSFYKPLLESRINIFERTGNFNHSKAMLVDDEWVFMGSSNCDNRSFRLNYELDFICYDGNFTEVIKSQIEKELSLSTEITLADVENISVFQNLTQNLCSLFSPVL